MHAFIRPAPSARTIVDPPTPSAESCNSFDIFEPPATPLDSISLKSSASSYLYDRDITGELRPHVRATCSSAFHPPPHSSLFDRKEGYTPLNESALNHRSAECETSCSSSQKHAPKLSHPQFPVPPKNPKPPFAIPSSSASNLQTHKPTSIFYAHAKSTKPTRAKRHPYNPYVCYSCIH